jgi:hypothetical protein
MSRTRRSGIRWARGSTKGERSLRNAGDGIYNQGGSQLVLDVSQTTGGYAATFDIALEGV